MSTQIDEYIIHWDTLLNNMDELYLMLTGRNQTQKNTTLWLHFNEVQEQPESIYGGRS